jgi:glycolate oxidase FAD binding subunit
MASMTERVSRLGEIVGEANLIRDPDRLKIYAVDGKAPQVVAAPGNSEELSRVVAYAGREKMAVFPRGNGTKLGMGFVPSKVDLVLLTGRLNRIPDCDCENLTLCVEGGITLSAVQKRLAGEGKGYFLPLDSPYTEKATLGGIIATNSTGPKRFGYGGVRDLVTGMKAVFPNGDIVVSGGKTVKNVSGYDMCKLLIGSMGTLGIICEITFILRPLPEKEAALIIPFGGLDEAGAFIHELLHSQLLPVSVDILNAAAMQRIPAFFLPPGGKYLAAVGLEGVAETIERQAADMTGIAKKHRAIEGVRLDSDKSRAFWVAVRDFGQGLREQNPGLLTLKGNFLISRWHEMMKRWEAVTRDAGIECPLICQAGSGILHAYVPAEEAKAASLLKVIEQFASEAVRNEGNLVVESSPVSIKTKVDVWGHSRADREVMRRIKERIDSAGILNPGRFVGGI